MNNLLKSLRPKERRGSKPRCHLFTHGTDAAVARKLTRLIEPHGYVSVSDHWMPNGFSALEEPQLHKSTGLVDDVIAKKLETWWLAECRSNSRTPNFDIASTCSIGDRKGLLLVEAKAHDEELLKERAGKRETKYGGGSQRNHDSIGRAIEEAAVGLSSATGMQWRISRDDRYQMSNRFAWAWKISQLGLPVILVYLGFLKAEEMKDRGNPFEAHSDWERCVKEHSAPLFPPTLWNQSMAVGSEVLVPLIKSERLDL
jgi:hypothetical protein